MNSASTISKNDQQKIVVDILYIMQNPDNSSGINVIEYDIQYVLAAMNTAGAISTGIMDDLIIFNSTHMVYNYKIIELKDIASEDEFHLMLLNSYDYDKYKIVLEVLKMYEGDKTIMANINMILAKAV